MVRAVNKLTSAQVKAIKERGRHADGGGLYLVVAKGGSKQWAFLFRQGGRRLEMGLGGAATVSLAKARGKAREARAAIDAGRNPVETRNALKQIPTFGELADAVADTKAKGFRSAKSRAIWDRVFNTYAADLRPLRIDQVDATAVLRVLEPIWVEKAETGTKTRRCIEAVLDAAKAKGLRTGDNPAAWKGQLAYVLTKRPKLARGHLRAMPHADVPAFLTRIRESDAMTARALEFLILTAARSAEVVGARWGEIDKAKKVWTVPATRMKAGREHRVPLSARAMAVLDRVSEGSNMEPDSYIFPGPRKRGSLEERSLSTNAFRAFLLRLEIDVTTHGFRSSFRDWAGEISTFPREVAEAALAHIVGDETERAYRRGDALEKRRKLMEGWAAFVTHDETGSPR